MKGPSREVYNIPNRIFNFTVSRPNFEPPFIYSSFFTPTDDGVRF
jgi:hypothetical protein